MSKKVILSFQDFKRYAGSGSVGLIDFLTKQKIGKVEFTTKPYKTPASSTASITKWVIDLQKGSFLKLVNGKEEHSEKQSVGELIGEIMDLISMDKSNEYSSIAVYRRTGIPKHESKINEYGKKPKAGVQTNYAKEIVHQTGARESAVKQWLDMNEADPLSVLQGIGSGRIKRNDFIDALMSDNGTLEFLKKYNSDGKWSAVWKGTPKNESNIQKVKRMIREAVLKETPQQNKTVKSLLDKWTNEHTTDREEYLYLLSKITEEALRDANFYHNGVLTKIPNIFRVKPTFDGSNLDKLGFKFGTTVAQKCEWVASDIIGAIEFFLRMNGYQSVADNLVKLLEEKDLEQK